MSSLYQLSQLPSHTFIHSGLTRWTPWEARPGQGQVLRHGVTYHVGRGSVVCRASSQHPTLCPSDLCSLQTHGYTSVASDVWIPRRQTLGFWASGLLLCVLSKWPSNLVGGGCLQEDHAPEREPIVPNGLFSSLASILPDDLAFSECQVASAMFNSLGPHGL